MGHPSHELNREFETVIKYIYGQPFKEIPQILADLGYSYTQEPILGYQMGMVKFISGNHKITIHLSDNGVGIIQRISIRNPLLDFFAKIIETILVLISVGGRFEENQIQFQYQQEVRNL